MLELENLTIGLTCSKKKYQFILNNFVLFNYTVIL